MNTHYLRKLTDICGVSGFEGNVADFIELELASSASIVSRDSLGSVIVESPKRGALKIALMAHTDEVGFMVRTILPNGFLLLYPLGNVDLIAALDAKVWIQSSNHELISGTIHSCQDVPASLYVDAGFSSQHEAIKAFVEPGNQVCFQNAFSEDENFVFAKALDNRICCALGMEIFHSLAGELPCHFYFIGSAQEEVGTRGARTSAALVQPDICIVLDVASPKDHPEHHLKTRLMDKGPAICIADKGALGNKRLIQLMKNTAIKENIPFQYDFLGGGTDTGAVQQASLNCEAMALILPVRDCHKPISSASKNDYNATLTLVKSFLHSLFQT
ncbi:MAG: M42 family metallopeptidase [Brevinema sp.]